MRQIGTFLLVLWLFVAMAGCSGLQCYFGKCKDLPNEAYIAEVASKSADNAELQSGLQRVASVEAEIEEQTGWFGGLYANAAYTNIIRKGAALSAELAARAERGELSTEEMQAAMAKFATHFGKLEAGIQGEP